MMRRLWVCLLVLLALPGHAAVLGVQSGEHNSFTRVVVALPNAMSWTLEQADNRAILRLIESGHSFDLSRAFERIPRDRVQELSSPAASRLDLKLGCDCAVTAFLHAGRYLVLDVAPAGDEWPDVAAPVQRADASPEIPATEVAEDPVFVLPITSNVPATRVQPGPLADLLMSEIEAAAMMGLLSPSEHMRTIRADVIVQRSTSFDDTVAASFDTAVSRYCPVDAGTLTLQWAGDKPYSQALGDMRAATLDMVGNPVPPARRAFAKFQISHGLGYEALALLADATDPEADVLRSMASVLERRPNVPPAIFRDCPGFAPWEVMRRVLMGDTDGDFEDAVLIAAYHQLSPVLRAMFQDDTLAFLDVTGHRDTLNTLRAYLDRTVPGAKAPAPPSDVALSAVAQPSHNVPQALLKRFATLTSAAQAPETDRRLIESYRTEYRGTQSEPEFWRATLRVHLIEGDYAQALTEVRQGRMTFPVVFDTAWAEVALHITEQADDIGFLRMAMAIDAGDLPRPERRVAEQIAERQDALGF